jgi:hypothetical protein
MTSQRFKLASAGWMAAMIATVHRVLSDVDAGSRFVLMEVFTDLPDGVLANAADGYAWHLCVDRGQVSARSGAIEDADLTVKIRFSVADAASRLTYADPAQSQALESLMSAALAAGDMAYFGDAMRMPPGLGERLQWIHDAMAPLTE